MKCKKGKCQFLSLGRNNPRRQDSLGTNHLENILAEKDLGDTKLTTSEECALAAKVSWVALGRTLPAG